MGLLTRTAVIVAAGVLAGACTTLSVDFAGSTASEWPTFGQGGERAGGAAYVAGDSLTLEWSYNANAGFGPISPVQVGEALVIVTRRGEVHALRIDGGRRFGSDRFGETIDGTPVVDGPTVYVPIGRHTRKGIKSFDLRAGVSLWEKRMGAVETGLLQVDRSLFAIEEGKTLRRIAAQTGADEWSADLTPFGRVTTPPLEGPNGTIVVADVEGHLLAFDIEDGTLRWQRRFEAPVYQAPALAGGLLYVPTTRGLLLAVDASDGREVWRFDGGNRHVRLTSVSVLGDAVVVAATDGRVVRLRAGDGAVLWTVNVGEAVGAPPLHLEDAVIVGTLGRSLLMLDAEDGRVRWSAELTGRVKSAMAATQDGVFVLAEPTSAYRFSYAANTALADGK